MTPNPLLSTVRRRAALLVVAAVVVAVGAAALLLRDTSPQAVSGMEADPPATIPDTAYEVPAGAIFLSVQGDDGAVGDEASPVRSLERALSLVPDGGTVVVRGGIYRDGSSTGIDKTVTLQPYPHEQVWFDGTDVTTGWYSVGDGVWALDDWSTPSFCDGQYYDVPYDQQREDNTGPCTHLDMSGHPDNPAAGDPQMLFLDGEPVREVLTRDEVEGPSFFYDQQARQVFLGVDPQDRLVEMAARPMALRLEGGDGGSVVRGLGFRRFASNEFNGNVTHGAVLSNQPGNLIEGNAFTQMAGAAVSVANSRDVVVRANRFIRNGFNGLDANGSSTRGDRDDILIEGNLFDGNNTELFGKGCSASCAAAGSKLAHMNGLTVRDNVFQNTREGTGFWCDLDCSRAVITRNVFRDNGGSGLYYEVSDEGIIADNLMIGNDEYGLKSGSADMEIAHNTLVGNGTNVLLYDDDRSPGVDGWDDIGPDTADNDFYNNVLVGADPPLSAWRTSSSGENTGPDLFLDDMDFNTYHRPSGRREVLIDWREEQGSRGYRTLEEFHEDTGHEQHGQDLTGRRDLLFVHREDGDYRIRSSSPASDSGRPLPEDVAEVLDLEPGSVHDRGALTTTG